MGSCQSQPGEFASPAAANGLSKDAGHAATTRGGAASGNSSSQQQEHGVAGDAAEGVSEKTTRDNGQSTGATKPAKKVSLFLLDNLEGAKFGRPCC